MEIAKLSSDKWSFVLDAGEADRLFLALEASESCHKNEAMKALAMFFGFEYNEVPEHIGAAHEVPKKASKPAKKGVIVYPFGPVVGTYNDLHTSKMDYIKAFQLVVSNDELMAKVIEYYEPMKKIHAIKEIRAYLFTAFSKASGLYESKCICDVLYDKFNVLVSEGTDLNNCEFLVGT